MFVFWKEVWYIFHKVAKSNQSVFPARRHSKKERGLFIMKKLTALLLSLYAAFADDGEKIRDSVGVHAKNLQ